MTVSQSLPVTTILTFPRRS